MKNGSMAPYDNSQAKGSETSIPTKTAEHQRRCDPGFGEGGFVVSVLSLIDVSVAGVGPAAVAVGAAFTVCLGALIGAPVEAGGVTASVAAVFGAVGLLVRDTIGSLSSHPGCLVMSSAWHFRYRSLRFYVTAWRKRPPIHGTADTGVGR